MRNLLLSLALLAALPAHAAEPARWQPGRITSFDVQLNDPSSAASVPLVDVVELDHDVAPGIVQALKARGTKLICYINAGAWERYRSDKDAFPKELLGNGYDGFPEERWLDIRAIDALAPIMRARLDQCKAKGFDAVDPDNINGYAQATGFPTTRDHQLAYNRWLMHEAHARGLAIALKNAPEFAEQLAAEGYDMAVTESCFADGFCEQFIPFIATGKPVLNLEYIDEGMALEDFCDAADALGIRSILKRSSSSVDDYRESCPN